jgi:FtsP/CotA-like multicopper oxidase with cupredoxin domain
MINRRHFLYLAGAGALNLLNVNGWPFTKAGLASSNNKDFNPDLELSLTAAPAKVQISPGEPTTVWAYKGQVTKGDPDSMMNPDQSYLGPIIRTRMNRKIRIHFKNNLPDESIIHWHGLHVPAKMDGHPMHVIPSGKTFTYEFEVLNRAGTYWYHPHPHGRTGHQVYGGLAGLFLVSDDIPAAGDARQHDGYAGRHHLCQRQARFPAFRQYSNVSTAHSKRVQFAHL